MLPWLANGRLSGAERLRVEEHLRGCALCTREVALQRRLCDVLTEPERVTYAPGPSFRKLMDRIDGREPATPGFAEARPTRLRSFAARRGSAWQPPGLAWAASFLLLVGFVGLAATTYRWSQPRYSTYTSVPASASAADASPELRALAARLRPDTRVRWVEPISGTAAADTLPHGPPQP